MGRKVHVNHVNCAKPMGLFRNLMIHIHGILCVVTFVIMKNNILDANYSILLHRPWFRDAKVSHDWGTNLITNEDRGIVISIVVTKRLDGTIKHEVLLCHDFVNGIINEEENILFVA
jgi:hypothetical protein